MRIITDSESIQILDKYHNRKSEKYSVGLGTASSQVTFVKASSVQCTEAH